MVTVALSRRPSKRPTWTRTSVTAKATPATVITNRSRSWKRFRRASETMASALLRREAAEGVVDDLVDEVGRGRAVRPARRGHGDERGGDAVHAHPEDLGRGHRVHRAEAAGRDGALHRAEQKGEGERAGAALLAFAQGDRRHEHEAVLVRVAEGEGDVGAPELADRLDRVRRHRRVLHRREQAAEVDAAEFSHEGVLVLEVEVDGRGRVLDGLRDAPHRDLVVALGGEALPSGVEDLAPDRFSFPLAPFRDAHVWLRSLLVP